MCLSDKTISKSMDVEFFKHVFPLKKSLSVSCLSSNLHDLENSSAVSKTPEFKTINSSNRICELESRRSKRQRTEKRFTLDFLSIFIV